jgi:hypothetical protein
LWDSSGFDPIEASLRFTDFETHYVFATRVSNAVLGVWAYLSQAQLVAIDISDLWIASNSVNQLDFDRRFLAPGNLDGRNQLPGPNALDTSLTTGVFEFDPSENQILVAAGFVVSEFHHRGNVGDRGAQRRVRGSLGRRRAHRGSTTTSGNRDEHGYDNAWCRHYAFQSTTQLLRLREFSPGCPLCRVIIVVAVDHPCRRVPHGYLFPAHRKS